MKDFETLKKTVQRNCDLVDAENAQNFGLCIYLMRMWGYYRWWHGLDMLAQIANEEILPWIGDVEEYWETLEDEAFGKLILDGKAYDPFKTDEINNILNPEKLVYSGGLAYAGIPMFFLARLENIQYVEGFKIVITDQEFARGLYGFPAMIQGQTVYIRKDGLKNMIWSRYEEWQGSKRDNSLGRALAFYDFGANPEDSLKSMVEEELNTLILHEVGEGKVKKVLGEEWGDMLIDFAHSKTEIIARAVKDLAADCLMTLPSLIENNNLSSIHFYFANFSDMRKALYPQLFEAYQNWVKGADMSDLAQLVDKGRTQWHNTGEKILKMYRENGKSAGELINKLVA